MMTGGGGGKVQKKQRQNNNDGDISGGIETNIFLITLGKCRLMFRGK